MPTLSVRTYADRHGLSVAFLRRIGVGNDYVDDVPAVRIPYLDENGREVAVRYRTALEAESHGAPVFRWKRGSRPTLYGLWQLAEAEKKGYAWLVQSESDCHALWSKNIPAFALPEPIPDWPQKLAKLKTIYVLRSPSPKWFVSGEGAGGEGIPEGLVLGDGRSEIVNSQSSIVNRIGLVQLPGNQTLTDLLRKNPAALDKAMASARPLSEQLANQRALEAEALRTAAAPIAKQPDILELLTEDLHRRGVVGEERTLQLLYLVLTSRLLDSPVSAVLKGPSSAGKSFALRRVLDYFPPSAYHVLSSMSPHAMIYDREPLVHRMLILNEAQGLSGKLTALLLRGILSEGQVRYSAVESTKTGTRTRLVERDGPTGFVTTTSEFELERDTATRMLAIPISEGSDQTAAILWAMAEGKEVAPPSAEWLAFQSWLEAAERRVQIPYAGQLVALIPPVSVRLRRDARVLLSLIQVHAIVHQMSRERDAEGRIVAGVEDYAAVRALVEDLLAEAADSAVPEEIRVTVETVNLCIFTDQQTATVQVLSQMMRLDKSAVSRRVHKAIAMGYLTSENGRTRVQSVLPGEPLPAEQAFLPDVGLLGSGSFSLGDLGGAVDGLSK